MYRIPLHTHTHKNRQIDLNSTQTLGPQTSFYGPSLPPTVEIDQRVAWDTLRRSCGPRQLHAMINRTVYLDLFANHVTFKGLCSWLLPKKNGTADGRLFNPEENICPPSLSLPNNEMHATNTFMESTLSVNKPKTRRLHHQGPRGCGNQRGLLQHFDGHVVMGVLHWLRGMLVPCAQGAHTADIQ